MLHVVVDEWLQEELVHGWPQRIAANRPLIVGQHADHPMSRRCQQDDRGAEQHFSLPENRIGRGGNGKDWTRAPDQLAWVRRRKKELLGNVANPARVAVEYRAGLTDHGNDSARDQVPGCVDVQRNDRLNVEYFLGALEWSSVEVRVALERKTDHIGDWILRLFRQVFVRRPGRSSSSTRPFDCIGKAALELIVQTHFDHLNVAVQL